MSIKYKDIIIVQAGFYQCPFSQIMTSSNDIPFVSGIK
jgi:hypothetical protein